MQNQEQSNTGNAAAFVNALTPTGPNAAASGGGALAWFVIWYANKRGAGLTAEAAAPIAILMTIGAGYFHEFMSLLLNRLRGK